MNNIIPLTQVKYTFNNNENDEDDSWSMSPKVSNSKYFHEYILYFRNKDDIDIWRKTNTQYKIIEKIDCSAITYNGTLYPVFPIKENEIYNFFLF